MTEEGIIVVSKTQLRQLQEKIKPLFPHSLKILGITNFIQSGLLEREILVNKWPDFTALVEKPIPGRKGLEFLDKIYSVFTTSADHTDLQDFLLKPGVVDWQQKQLLIPGCSITAQTAVTEAAEKQGSKALVSIVGHMYCLTDKDALLQIETPADYSIGSLNPEDASTIAPQWVHAREGHCATDYIGFLLENRLSVAVRDSVTGALVGYYIQQLNDSLGMLYVTEEHRGKGLGKLLVVETAKRVSENGDPVFCYVEDSNPISAALHEKCGFKKEADVAWMSIRAADRINLS